MSKDYDLDIDSQLKDLFFIPVRNKMDQALVLLNAIKILRVAHKININDPVGKLVLKVSKMSRITFCIENKIVSLALPFYVKNTDGRLEFESKSIGVIDSVSISNAIAIFSNETLIEADCISALADEVLDIASYKPGFWGFIRELLLMEDGYVRFDRDEDRVNGHYHPLDHLDVFYSNKATFKLGLRAHLDESQFLDILDIGTECHYLNKLT